MKYVSTKSCVNLFRPLLKKKSFGVVWALNDQEMWMESIKKFENGSQLVCNVCLRLLLTFSVSNFEKWAKEKSKRESSPWVKRG